MDLILLYIPLYDPQSRELEVAIQSVLKHKSFTVLRDLGSLEVALLRGLTTPYLIVLSIPSHEELLGILALREELIRSNVVVVLSDQGAAAAAYVHSLRPRFVGYGEDDCRTVVEVVSRLIRGLDPSGESASARATDAVSSLLINALDAKEEKQIVLETAISPSPTGLRVGRGTMR